MDKSQTVSRQKFARTICLLSKADTNTETQHITSAVAFSKSSCLISCVAQGAWPLVVPTSLEPCKLATALSSSSWRKILTGFPQWLPGTSSGRLDVLLEQLSHVKVNTAVSSSDRFSRILLLRDNRQICCLCSWLILIGHMHYKGTFRWLVFVLQLLYLLQLKIIIMMCINWFF